MAHYFSDFFYRPTSVVQVCRKCTPHIMCRFGWYYIVKADETKNRITILEDALELYETKQGCFAKQLSSTKALLNEAYNEAIDAQKTEEGKDISFLNEDEEEEMELG